MLHVKFYGSGFIGLRNFTLFVVDFFSTDRTFLTEIKIPYFYIVIVLFSCYSHQSISDYSWEVYIVHSGVFAG